MTDIQKLAQTAKEMRRQIITMLHQAGSGHPGGFVLRGSDDRSIF